MSGAPSVEHLTSVLDAPGTRALVGVGRGASSVMALLSGGDRPDLVFTERAATLRSHAGQMSFPGGRIEPDDPSAAAAAMRETTEEIGLGADEVTVLGELPPTSLTTQVFNVIPVVATWSGEAPIAVVDPAEVTSIHRFAVDDLADPEHRVAVHHPRGGMGPAFVFGDYMVWGFTAHLVDELLRLGGWERAWTKRMVPIPPRFLRSGL